MPRLKKEQSYTFTPTLCLHDLFRCELYLLAFYSNLTSVTTMLFTDFLYPHTKFQIARIEVTLIGEN